MADRFLVGVLLLLSAAGCTGPGPTTAPVDPATAVQATLDQVNATAGGDVAGQQQVLRRLVDPTRVADQDACPPATITVRIDAVLDRLALAPPTATGATADAGTAGTAGTADAATATAMSTTGVTATGTAVTTSAGDRYRLPVLLEVYTGGLRTGTDLAALDIVVIAGTAHTAPLCLR